MNQAPDDGLWWNPATGIRSVGGKIYTEEEWKQREADAAFVIYGGQSPPPCTCAAFKEALDRRRFDPTIQEFNGRWAFGTLSLPAMKFCPWCGHPVPDPSLPIP